MAYLPGTVLTIICDAESHAPKVVTIDRIEAYQSAFGFQDMVGGAWLSQVLVDDVPDDHTELFGTSITGPSPARMEDARRARWHRTLECNLCGLKLDLREEDARRLVDGFRIEGQNVRSTIRLAALVKARSIPPDPAGRPSA